jgi:hypothetical protein
MGLTAIAPKFTLKGQVFTFRAMDPWTIVIPLVVSPVAFSARLLCRNQAQANIVAISIMGGLIVIGTIIWQELFGTGPGWGTIIMFSLLMWLVFILYLRFVCLRRSLVMS